MDPPPLASLHAVNETVEECDRCVCMCVCMRTCASTRLLLFMLVAIYRKAASDESSLPFSHQGILPKALFSARVSHDGGILAERLKIR